MSDTSGDMGGPSPLGNEDRSVLLRDHLATDRTVLANERTFLSFLRTALTMFVAGITFIKFFDSTAVEIIGWSFLPFSALLVALAVYSYRRTSKAIKRTVCE